MSRKRFLIAGLTGLIFLAVGLLLWAMTPSFASAQCGDTPPKSSCITCHEKEDPVFQNGAWHGIHALKDCCTNCHGGNCSATDKTLAHEGLVADPLEDIYVNCYHCHPDDYQEKAQRFAVLLGVTPGSSPTATPFPSGPGGVHEIVILPRASLPVSRVNLWGYALGGFVLTFILLMTFGVAFYKHRRSGHICTQS
jgi:hypothetical protein